MIDPEKCAYCGNKPTEQCEECGGCETCCESEYHCVHCGHPGGICTCPEIDLVDSQGKPATPGDG